MNTPAPFPPPPLPSHPTPSHGPDFFALNPIALQPLSPGQILVIHSEQPLPVFEKEKLTRQLKALLRGHNNTFAFIDGPFRTGVATPK